MDKPILFSAPMVRALLDGRKTQTRRVLKPQPNMMNGGHPLYDGHGSYSTKMGWKRIPYAVCDRLWVQEQCATWGRGPGPEPVAYPVAYAADDPEWDGIKRDAKSASDEWKIRPSIHMPRWASRLTLTVTDVRVQRIQEICRDDAFAEGIERVGGGIIRWERFSGADGQSGNSPEAAFAVLWNSLNADRGFGWEENPWVCALTFTVEHRNIDK